MTAETDLTEQKAAVLDHIHQFDWGKVVAATAGQIVACFGSSVPNLGFADHMGYGNIRDSIAVAEVHSVDDVGFAMLVLRMDYTMFVEVVLVAGLVIVRQG